jgi:hypothetical protein
MTDADKGETVAKPISAMNEIIEAWRAERGFSEMKLSDKWTLQVLHAVCPDKTPEGYSHAMQLCVDMSVNVERATSEGWQRDDFFSQAVTNQLCGIIAGLAKDLEASCHTTTESSSKSG